MLIMTQPSGTGIVPIRRSATLPSKLMPGRRQQISETPAAHDRFDPVLFFHPSAKIVKFAPDAPPALSQSAPSIDFDYPVDTIETLPWRSPTERTVAVGRLRLEIPTGLSPFLKCGNVVQAILKNSQCWCVDGKSTFVLRIRSLTYYRIELPDQTSEDAALIDNFKTALAKVLRYEVTPCPFQRGFSVPLPAEAHIPKKKRAWRPKYQRESAPAGSELDKAWPDAVSEDGTLQHSDSIDMYDGETTDESTSTTTTSAPHTDSNLIDDIQSKDAAEDADPSPTILEQKVSEPIDSVHDILARFQPIPESDSEDDSKSFHSLLPQDSKPSQSLSNRIRPSSRIDDRLPTFSLHNHNRDVSEATMTSGPLSTFQITPNIDPVQTHSIAREEGEHIPSINSIATSSAVYEPRLPDAAATVATGSEVLLPLSPTSDRRNNILMELRRTRSFKKRDLSPLPPASTLEYLTPRPSKSMTELLFNKATSLVLVLPLQLLVFFIHLAAQFLSDDSAQMNTSEGAREMNNESNGEEDDFQMPQTPGTFRRSMSLEDSRDTFSDLE